MSPEGYVCYEQSCVLGSNIEYFADYTRQQCADACDENEKCLAFKLGVEYGATVENAFNSGDCKLQNSINMYNCDESYWNTELCVKSHGGKTNN